MTSFEASHGGYTLYIIGGKAVIYALMHGVATFRQPHICLVMWRCTCVRQQWTLLPYPTLLLLRWQALLECNPLFFLLLFHSFLIIYFVLVLFRVNMINSGSHLPCLATD